MYFLRGRGKSLPHLLPITREVVGLSEWVKWQAGWTAAGGYSAAVWEAGRWQPTSEKTEVLVVKRPSRLGPGSQRSLSLLGRKRPTDMSQGWQKELALYLKSRKKQLFIQLSTLKAEAEIASAAVAAAADSRCSGWFSLSPGSFARGVRSF